MKNRLGFVSNSSSASFIVRKTFLDEEKKSFVRNYIDEAAKSDMEWPEEAAGWSMFDNDDHFKFYTTMDNFSLDEFFARNGISVESYENY